VGVQTPKKLHKTYDVLAHSMDKKPACRIVLLKPGIQIRVLRALKLSGSRRLSTGFFRQLIFRHTEACEQQVTNAWNSCKRFFRLFL
jgi:hypothetical protein